MSPASSRRAAWLATLVLAIVAVAMYHHFGVGTHLTLAGLKSGRAALLGQYDEHPLRTVAAFALVYVVAVAASIPGAAVLTLAAGAIFGLVLGTIVVSFASSVGALLAFLAARYLLQELVQSRFARQLGPINDGMRREGWVYLLTLRLVPVLPFFLVNLASALTPIKAWRFYWVSQLGMLAGTLVYVNAGTRLAQVGRLSDVLSPGLLLSFALLGLLPIVGKRFIALIQRRQVYKGWVRPRSFDRNLVVIGAGAGGLVTSYIAAAVKAKVTLVEANKMGGDCLNFGCVPSKALIRVAKVAHQMRRAEELGLENASAAVDFGAVMARIHRVIAEIEPHDSVERYSGLGVEVLSGYARITSPWTVEITSAEGVQTLSTRNIVIATGARPSIPDIPHVEEVGCLTSDTLWQLKELPGRLLVLGGGPVGCELAQSFVRLGSVVTQVEMGERVMLREDPEVSAMVEAALRADGVTLLTGHRALRFERDGPGRRLFVQGPAGEFAIEFDAVLCATGRTPRVHGFGLEALGIPLTARKTIETDAWLRTRYPNIFAVGDVAGPYQLTHVAAHQAWYAAVNGLFGRFRQFKADYSVIPWATFTDPEVARVGLSESEATEQGVAYEVTRFDFADLDRSIADATTAGFVKVLTVPGKDRILGATIVGEHAGDLLAEFVLAMKHGLGLGKLLATIHVYPTLSEANKYAAGAWKRAHAPLRLLAWAGRFHAWERG